MSFYQDQGETRWQKVEILLWLGAFSCLCRKIKYGQAALGSILALHGSGATDAAEPDMAR